MEHLSKTLIIYIIFITNFLKVTYLHFADMRIKYKDKNETFTEDQLNSKEPFGQFKAWFEIACNTPSILEPNAMLLGTATKFVKVSL